jgi:N-acetylmuramoyl-L-alanine amidase
MQLLRLTGVVLLGALISACAPLPTVPQLTQYSRLPVVPSPSANFSARRPSFVVLHHTGSSDTKTALETLTRSGTEVSAHYLVGRDGRLYYLVDEQKRAWHAGPAYWGGEIDMNSASIGIEVDNNGFEPYTDVQIDTLLALLADLKERYRIPVPNFIAHGDLAPGRKVDPGVNFPWRRLAASGFGLWCEPPFDAVPQGLDAGILLGVLGYDMSNADAAIGAFNRRFVGIESTRLGESDRARLYCLVTRKKMGG